MDDEGFSFIVDELATEMKNSFAEAFERDEYIARAVAARHTYRGKFEQLVSVGSDAGSLGHFHHDAIGREMSAWMALGRPPHAILEAATRSSCFGPMSGSSSPVHEGTSCSTPGVFREGSLIETESLPS